MKDTTPRLYNFRAEFAKGALARTANSDCAAHGAEMDAPEFIPSGGWNNHSTALVYPRPRMGAVCR